MKMNSCGERTLFNVFGLEAIMKPLAAIARERAIAAFWFGPY